MKKDIGFLCPKKILSGSQKNAAKMPVVQSTKLIIFSSNKGHGGHETCMVQLNGSKLEL